MESKIADGKITAPREAVEVALSFLNDLLAKDNKAASTLLTLRVDVENVAGMADLGIQTQKGRGGEQISGTLRVQGALQERDDRVDPARGDRARS